MELLGRGSPAAAAQVLQRASMAEPASRSVREALARAQFDAGQYAEAADNFRMIVEASPSDDYAHFGLGLALARTGHPAQYWTLAIFGVATYVLTALTGLTLGKRLTGIRVARLDGKPVGFLWALVRTLLLLAVIPPLVTDRDMRGLHDRAANTIVVRL